MFYHSWEQHHSNGSIRRVNPSHDGYCVCYCLLHLPLSLFYMFPSYYQPTGKSVFFCCRCFFAVVAGVLFFFAVVAGARFFFCCRPRRAFFLLLSSLGARFLFCCRPWGRVFFLLSLRGRVFFLAVVAGARFFFLLSLREPGLTHSLASWVRATTTKTNIKQLQQKKHGFPNLPASLPTYLFSIYNQPVYAPK